MTLHTGPRLSVVMATYNAEPYVEAAIRSILQQTFGDYEFIIIDDGSQDGTWGILERLAAQDKRIRLERNVVNSGVSRTRNRGTELARGELIAVMDADDISLPNRLEKQVAYLDTHSDVGVVGGSIALLQNEKIAFEVTYPLTPGHSAWRIFYGVPVAHPAAMLRRALLVHIEGYRPEYVVAHDYDLWERLSHTTGFASLPDLVLHYRRHTDNITLRRQVTMEHEVALIAQRAVATEIGTQLSLSESSVLANGHRATPEQTPCMSHLIFRLAHHVRRKYTLTKEEWNSVRQDAAFRILRLARSQTPWSRSGFSGLYYVVRLDPERAIQWLVSAIQVSARHHWKAGLNMLRRVRPS